MDSSFLFGSAPINHANISIRKTHKILNKEERIVAVLVGRPSDLMWKDAIEEAAAAMQEVMHEGILEGHIGDKYLSHHCGEFVTLPSGVSFGGGQTVSISESNFIRPYHMRLTAASGKKPGNLIHPKEWQWLIQKLKKCLGIICIVGFQSSMYLINPTFWIRSDHSWIQVHWLLLHQNYTAILPIFLRPCLGNMTGSSTTSIIASSLRQALTAGLPPFRWTTQTMATSHMGCVH
jgi:hypothetical protein